MPGAAPNSWSTSGPRFPSRGRARPSSVVTPDAAELARLAALVDEGRLRPILSQSYPLRDGRKAFESATAPHPPGKTVLIVR